MWVLWWERSITIFTTHLFLRTGIGGPVTVRCTRAAPVLPEAVLHHPHTLDPHLRTQSGLHRAPDRVGTNPTEDSLSPPGPAAEIMSRHRDHNYSSTGRHEDRRDENYDRRQHDHHGSRSSRNNEEHRRVTHFTFSKSSQSRFPMKKSFNSRIIHTCQIYPPYRVATLKIFNVLTISISKRILDQTKAIMSIVE